MGDDAFSVLYRGVKFDAHNHSITHHNRAGETFHIDRTIFYNSWPSLDVVVCRRDDTQQWYLLDSQSYGDAEPDTFFDDVGPFDTLEDALAAYWPYVVAYRLGG